MSRLAVSLLGPFRAALEGRPLLGFRSDKARALLVYLAVEADRPHAREALAGLLWPDYPNATALTYLRSTLSNLRHLLADFPAHPAAPDPFLLITRQTVQLNPQADVWLDTVALARLLDGQPGLNGLEQAAALCRGPVLEGFSVSDAAGFDEWLLFKREQYNRLALAALYRLSAVYIAHGQYTQAQAAARRQLALDPWDEAAHRQLMVSLALDNQAGAALAHYETCRRALLRDLGVAPARETTQLRDSIQNGTLQDALQALKGDARLAAPFVVREPELAGLDRHLDLALAGAGRVVFVTGEAGSGKTTLMREFARRAIAAHRSAASASGKCSSSIGLGDPYLPFREVVQMLTGDVEPRQTGADITPEYIQRLWAVAPTAVQNLLDSAPELVNRFVPGEALALRVETVTRVDGRGAAPERAPLADRVRRQADRNRRSATLEQWNLFEQVTAFLRSLARQHPLILLLDDLQWADNGSISMLFHLGRSLAGSRILIVGAYRPEDVALGRDGRRHPLAAVVHELQRDFGDIEVDLNLAEGRAFIDSLVDSEPNRLGEAFRETLYRHTEGHALFAVELMTSLREHGGLARNAAGEWVEGETLNWEAVPARVDAIVAERIERLPAETQSLLGAASVEGEEFTGEVVGYVQGLGERELQALLSHALSHDAHLIRSGGLQRIEGHRLSHYRFRHHLFWQHLYSGLDELERLRLHEAVGTALEALYAPNADPLVSRAPELAWHFEEAGLTDKAVHYRHMAGDQAMRLAAHEDAIAHYMRALALLDTLPASAARIEREAALRVALSTPLTIIHGWGGPEMSGALTRAYELAQAVGAWPQLVATLLGLASAYVGQGEAGKALALAEELRRLAEQAEDVLALAAAYHMIGLTLMFSGDFRAARDRLEQALSLYDSQPLAPPLLMGVDQKVACLTWLAWVLWPLGYPDQAAEHSRAALARARGLGQPTTLAFALAMDGALFHTFRRELDAAQAYQEELLRVTENKGLVIFQVLAMIVQGSRRAEQGQVEAGIEQILQGAATWEAMGTTALRVLQLIVLIRAYRAAGHVEEALRIVAQALPLAERGGLRYGEAKLWRLRGELLLSGENVDETAAEACFQRAIAIARQQGARLWELRASVSLARLWQRQARGDDARALLAAIHGWFSEGFDTPDLTEARTLLDELTPSFAY